MYYAKFVGGPQMGQALPMNRTVPALNFQTSEPAPLFMPDGSLTKGWPVTVLRYELRNVMGEGDHKFCFYALADEGWT